MARAGSTLRARESPELAPRCPVQRARALDRAHCSIRSLFRRIANIADLIDAWNARNAYVSARSASSSGPSSARESDACIPPRRSAARAPRRGRRRSRARSWSIGRELRRARRAARLPRPARSAPRELACAAQPAATARCAEPLKLVGLVPPGEIGVLGTRPPASSGTRGATHSSSVPSSLCSSHSASVACSRPRRAFGIVPYADLTRQRVLDGVLDPRAASDQRSARRRSGRDPRGA